MKGMICKVTVEEILEEKGIELCIGIIGRNRNCSPSTRASLIEKPPYKRIEEAAGRETDSQTKQG